MESSESEEGAGLSLDQASDPKRIVHCNSVEVGSCWAWEGAISRKLV